MGHKLLNRISRIFQAPNKPTADTTNYSLSRQHEDDLFNRYDNIKDVEAKEKKRWTSTFSTKRIKGQSIMKDLLDIEDSKHHDFIPCFYQEKVEQFNDEKVEIIVPSDSMSSFISSTTRTSGYQTPSFHYSTLDLLPSSNHSKITGPEDTPRTSVDIESLKFEERSVSFIDQVIQKPSIGLANMVKDILGDAFSIADQEEQHES